MIKFLFLFAILVFDLFAKEKLFLLPNDSKKFIEHFQQDVKSAHNSIIVVRYNFQSKDIYKLLKKKVQEDISITLIYDSKYFLYKPFRNLHTNYQQPKTN